MSIRSIAVSGPTIVKQSTPATQYSAEVAVHADVVTALEAANSNLFYEAVEAGEADAEISVAYVVPEDNDSPLSVAVVEGAITVSLATDDAGAAISTAAQVKAAIEANVDANALVTVTYPAGNDGSGVLVAMAAAPLVCAVATVTWQSSATKVASVTNAGVVTFKDDGTFKLTAKSTVDVNIKGELDITVGVGTPEELRAAMPDRITGEWACEYIKSMSVAVQERFAELQSRSGITIPEDSTLLRSQQLELFMDCF